MASKNNKTFKERKPFKESNNFENRRIASINIRAQHPDKIPVIINIPKNSEIVLRKTRFIIPGEMKLSAFIFELRKYIDIDQSTTMFLFVDSVLPPASITIEDLDSKYRDYDGFLYLSCIGENAFG